MVQVVLDAHMSFLALTEGSSSCSGLALVCYPVGWFSVVLLAALVLAHVAFEVGYLRKLFSRQLIISPLISVNLFVHMAHNVGAVGILPLCDTLCCLCSWCCGGKTKNQPQTKRTSRYLPRLSAWPKVQQAFPMDEEAVRHFLTQRISESCSGSVLKGLLLFVESLWWRRVSISPAMELCFQGEL